MASAARRLLREATAYAAYAVAREAGDLATYQYRAATAISVYVIPGAEVDASTDELGLQEDVKVRDFLLSSAQAGIRARVTNKALATNVVTLTTNKAHGFVAGQEIRVVMDTADSSIDGLSRVIVETPTTTTLTYAKTAANITSQAAGGDIEAIVRPGDTLTHESEAYEIDTVEPDSLRAVYRLRCRSRRARHSGIGS
jgi:hypothetical protein